VLFEGKIFFFFLNLYCWVRTHCSVALHSTWLRLVKYSNSLYTSSPCSTCKPIIENLYSSRLLRTQYTWMEWNGWLILLLKQRESSFRTHTNFVNCLVFSTLACPLFSSSFLRRHPWRHYGILPNYFFFSITLVKYLRALRLGWTRGTTLADH